MSNDKMMGKFEVWATSPDGPVSIYSTERFDGEYGEADTEIMWRAWQAASAVQADEIAQLTSELAQNAKSVYQLTQHLARTQSQVNMPDGWQLVPIEPTGVMKDCGASSLPLACSNSWTAGTAYRAMLAAAPKPPDGPFIDDATRAPDWSAA